MIYCNKRKEHIKPEVGQVWSKKYCDKNVRIIEIISEYKYHGFKENVEYPIICVSNEGYPGIDKFSEEGINKHSSWNREDLYILIKEAPKPPSPWQPIETAPKDGTRILVYKGNDSHIVWFNGGKFVKFNCDDDWYSVSFYEEELTHWMPLPEPPETEDA